MPQCPKEAQWLMCLYCHKDFEGADYKVASLKEAVDLIVNS